jgi:hypothetical protein
MSEDEVRQRIFEELQAEADELKGERGLGFLRAMYIVFYGRSQTPNIETEERDMIRQFRSIGLSYGHIAFITHRSKATIFEVVKLGQQTTNEPEIPLVI